MGKLAWPHPAARRYARRAVDAAGGATAVGRVVLERPITDPKTSASYLIIEVQNYFDCAGRTLATQRRTYYKEDQGVEILDEMTFSFYPNNAQLKPGCLSQTISLEGGSGAKNPLVKMLKFAHKKGATSVSLKSDNIEMFVPGAGRTPLKKKIREVLETWKQIRGSEPQDTEWLISKFDATL